MTDLEMTKLCAEAMGYRFIESMYGNWKRVSPSGRVRYCGANILDCGYEPLHDDAQAMALVKKFDLCLEPNSPNVAKWAVWRIDHEEPITHNADLNRAIVECVAKMQSAILSQSTHNQKATG